MRYTEEYLNMGVSAPQSAIFIKCKEILGHRLAILHTHSIEERPDTLNGGLRNVAEVDYADLDDGQGGRIQWGALVDKPGVVNRLKNQTTIILGRMSLGEAKTGQSAPFILDDPADEDIEFFKNNWLPRNRDALLGKASQPPAPAPQPTTTNGYAPPPAAPAPVPVAAAPAADPAAPVDPAYAAFQQMVASGQIKLPGA